jgi:hypothetical protein
MSTTPEAPSHEAPDADARHPTERERAIRASLLGLALGVFLWFVSRRRSA